MFHTAWDRELGQTKTSPRLQRRLCSKSIDLVQRMELQRMLEGHEGCVNTVAFDPSGRLLVSGSDDLRIIVWDWEAGASALAWTSGHQNNVFQARFMPHTDNAVLVSCAADGQVRATDVPPGAGPRSITSRKLAQHDGRAHRLALDPLNPRCCFYSCGEDGEVMHFDLRQPPAQCRRRLLVCHGTSGRAGYEVIDLNCIHVNPARPELFAVGGGDEWVRVYDHRRTASRSGAADDGGGSLGGRGGGGALSRLFGMPDEPVASLAPERLAPAGFGPRRRVFSKHVTGIQFSGVGELLASYNDDDIFLFAQEGYGGGGGGRGGSGGAGGRGSRAEEEEEEEKEEDRDGDEVGTAPAADEDAVGLIGPRRRRRSGRANGDEPPHVIRRLQRSGSPRGSGDGGGNEGGEGGSRERSSAAAAPAAAAAARASAAPAQAVKDADRLQTVVREDDKDEHGAGRRAEAQGGDEEGDGLDKEEDDDASGIDLESGLRQEQQQQQQRQDEPGQPRRRRQQRQAGSEEQQGRHQVSDYVIGVYSGHRNARTVKGVSFMGPDDEYVVSGSDDGHVYVWSKDTGALLWWARGDDDVVNCLEPHPFLPMTLATSGIDDTIKLWGPTAAERRPVPPEAHRVMQRNREARERGPDRAVLPVSPELLRLLFSGRRGGGGGEPDSGAVGGDGMESDEDGGSEGCRVS